VCSWTGWAEAAGGEEESVDAEVEPGLDMAVGGGGVAAAMV
jgi:hypothetical protein